MFTLFSCSEFVSVSVEWLLTSKSAINPSCSKSSIVISGHLSAGVFAAALTGDALVTDHLHDEQHGYASLDCIHGQVRLPYRGFLMLGFRFHGIIAKRRIYFACFVYLNVGQRPLPLLLLLPVASPRQRPLPSKGRWKIPPVRGRHSVFSRPSPRSLCAAAAVGQCARRLPPLWAPRRVRWPINRSALRPQAASHFPITAETRRQIYRQQRHDKASNTRAAESEQHEDADKYIETKRLQLLGAHRWSSTSRCLI